LTNYFSKISIGTANLENNYGFLKNNIITFNEFKKITEILKKRKIKFIDTSSVYGDSEKLLGKIKLDKFKVTTKCIFDTKTKSFKINDSYKNLKRKPDAILFHKFSDYKERKKKFLSELKKNKLKRFGVSIYSKNDFNIALKDKQIKVIQIPANFFNQKLLNKKLLEKAQKKRIEIEVRSIFMQGLLFEDLKKVIKVLKIKQQIKVQKLNKLLKKNNIRLATLSLFMIIKNPLINRIILGFNDRKQLLDIFGELNKIKKLKLSSLEKLHFAYNKNFNILNWKKN
jgi:aryl-alcohol dehydrogenase-like predicted oxidoreductase